MPVARELVSQLGYDQTLQQFMLSFNAEGEEERKIYDQEHKRTGYIVVSLLTALGIVSFLPLGASVGEVETPVLLAVTTGLIFSFFSAFSVFAPFWSFRSLLGGEMRKIIHIMFQLNINENHFKLCSWFAEEIII